MAARPRTTRRALASLALAASLIALTLLPGAALARPGALDRGFGDNGRVVTQTTLGGQSWLNADVNVAGGPDGTTVAAVGKTVFRYLPDGRVDTNFGEGGRLAIPEVEGLPFRISDITIDSADRILVFGTAADPSVTQEIPSYFTPIRVSPSFAVALRLDSTGKPDASFGNGDGIFRSGLGFHPLSEITGGIPLAEVESARLDSAGRIVMAIGVIGSPPSEGHSRLGWVVNSLARLTPSGALDSTFGGGKGSAEDILKDGEIYEDLCVAGGDEPVVAAHNFQFQGEIEGGRAAIGSLTRLRPDGSPDLTFGRGGVADERGGFGPIACERSGRISMLQASGLQQSRGAHHWVGKVVRLAPGGRVNRRFGRDGRATVRLPGSESELTSIAVDHSGRTLLAGTMRVSRGSRAKPRSFFTVIRLLASGKPDRDFGRGGWVRTGFGRRATIAADTESIDSSGRLTVVGLGHGPWLRQGGIVMARYLPGR